MTSSGDIRAQLATRASHATYGIQPHQSKGVRLENERGMRCERMQPTRPYRASKTSSGDACFTHIDYPINFLRRSSRHYQQFFHASTRPSKRTWRPTGHQSSPTHWWRFHLSEAPESILVFESAVQYIAVDVVGRLATHPAGLLVTSSSSSNLLWPLERRRVKTTRNGPISASEPRTRDRRHNSELSIINIGRWCSLTT